MKSGKFILTIFLLLATLVLSPTALAAPWLQGAVACEQEYVVQGDDWLSKIAEKIYADPFAYPAIAEATNAKYAEDNSFANIKNVDLIEPGWKLCIPAASEAEALMQAQQSVPQVAVSPAEPTGQQVGRLVLATTTSTQDSGLLDVILPDFETRYGADVEVIAVGTGQSIELGRNGDADVVLVHARSLEDQFVAEGFGINRQDVMYNDFIIIGPAADPAGIKGMTDAVAALNKLVETKSPFISRGDNSGTHTKEITLWEATMLPLIETASAADATKLVKRPEGDWYQSVGQGMGATLTIANEQQAYTLADRATYLARRKERLELEILVEGDSRLFNPYGVITVNPEKHPTVNAAGAQTFTEWLTSLETQQLISQFGTAEFGQSLFIPASAQWKAAKQQ
jgi:tungstate transport system substrate-binding protein